jgi:hypothetical protein
MKLERIAPTVYPEIPKLVSLDLDALEGKKLAEQRKLLCFEIEFFAQQTNPERQEIRRIKEMIRAIDAGETTVLTNFSQEKVKTTADTL